MNKSLKAKLLDRIYKALETAAGVERAIEILAANQTQDEWVEMATSHRNGVGFSGADARVGCLLAKRIRELSARGYPQGRRLYGQDLDNGRRIALKYARTQLFAAAVAKQIRS